MKIRYRGGRSCYKVTFNRQPYNFTEENNHILDILEQGVINHIFSLGNRTEFEAMVAPPIIAEEAKEVPLEIKKEEKKVEIKSNKLGRTKKGGK